MVKTRTISRIGAVILAFMVAVAMLGFTSEYAHADSGETLSGDGFEFKLWDEGDDEYSLLVTKYTGSDTTVVFPTSIQYNGKSYTVTGIENTDESVIGSNVTQVIIPKGYQAISGPAFANCVNLETVLIGNAEDDDDFYVYNGAFEGCPAEITYSAPEAQNIDKVIVIGADNKLPAPSNLQWYMKQNMPMTASWDTISEEYTEALSGYAVCVKWEKDGEEDTTSAFLRSGYHTFDTFFKAHGSGAYSFSVQAKAKEDSTYEDSDEVWTKPVQFSSVHLNIVTKEEDESVMPETTDSGNGYLSLFINGDERGGQQMNRGETMFYPDGSTLEFSAEREEGYLHRGTEFDNEPADLTQKGKVSKFTLTGNVDITVTFQKNSDIVPVIIDFCEGHEELAAYVAEYINDEGTYTAQAEGAILTIQYPLAGFPGDLDSTLDDIISEALEDRGGFDNGEMWESHVGKKPMQEYADIDDFDKEKKALEASDIEAGMKLVAQWSKKATKGSFTVKAPVCGTNVKSSSITQTNKPVAAENKDSQFEITRDGQQGHFTRWLTSDDPDKCYDAPYWFNGKIVGGTTYNAGLEIMPKWGFYLGKDIPEITINGKAANISQRSLEGGIGGVLIAGTVTAVHNWDAGKVTKEPTTKAKGVRTFTCKGCGKTKTESIAKLTVKEALEGGASAAAADTAIKAMKNDKDPAGTVFSKLRLRSNKQTKNSVKIVWNKVSGAKKYVIYGNKCGPKNKMKKLATVTGSSKVFKKIAGKKAMKGKYYKFMVVALNKNKKVITTSKVCHVATKGGKVTNYKSVTVKKAVITKAKNLKVGKSVKLGAKAVKAVKKAKVNIHVPVRYETTSKKIATVTAKGVIKAKKKGTCYVYAYAQNCVFKKIKVVVK